MTRQQAGVSADAVAKFRKKPVVIEAMLWTGEDNERGIQAAVKFCQPLPHAPDDPHIHTGLGYTPPDGKLYIPTLEGTMCANPGDWIIKGVKGEFYPCKPDIFEATYELALATARQQEGEGGATMPDGALYTSGEMVRCSQCLMPLSGAPESHLPDCKVRELQEQHEAEMRNDALEEAAAAVSGVHTSYHHNDPAETIGTFVRRHSAAIQERVRSLAVEKETK